MLKQAGVDEMITVSPHSPQMAKFAAEFGLKMREVDPSPLLASTIQTYLPDNPIIYSPDKGSIPRAIELAKLTGSQVLFSLKERGLSNEVEIKTEEETEVKDIIARYSTKDFSAIDYADAGKIKDQPIVMAEDEANTCVTANKTGRRLKALEPRISSSWPSIPFWLAAGGVSSFTRIRSIDNPRRYHTAGFTKK